MALLELRDLHKWYGDFHALRGISLAVEPGEVVVVCGPSGSGKSTLIRCVNRLEEFQQGRILFDGRDICGDGVDLTRLRSAIGIVFQQFNLYPHLTILDNVTLAPIKVKKLPRREAEAAGLALLDRVGIRDQAAKHPDALSGGQQQRAAIARALAMGLKEFLDTAEERLLVEALERSGGVKNQAAELLGIKRTTLIEKLKKRNMVLGLYLAKALGAAEAVLAAYATSGEASGDYRQVVGYAGVLVRAAG